jgi:hypothetical protein
MGVGEFQQDLKSVAFRSQGHHGLAPVYVSCNGRNIVSARCRDLAVPATRRF